MKAMLVRLPGLVSRVLIVVVLVAVVVGRWGRAPAEPVSSRPRRAAPSGLHVFDPFLFADPRHARRLLDTETGATRFLDLPDSAAIDAVSVSPWLDEDGRRVLTGRWRVGNGDATRRLSDIPLLVRWTYPGGRVVDRVAIEPLPFSPPCWFPDRSDRILYTAGDGRLYLFDFGEARGAETAAPRPVRWEAGPPGAEAPHVRDPCWPGGQAWGDRLVATVYTKVVGPDSIPLRGTRLWWLELSPDATAVVAAGRLTDEGQDASLAGDECWPSVSTRDGVPMVAYMVVHKSGGSVELRIASVDSPASGVPRIRPVATHRLSSEGILTSPAFSPDGRWVYAPVRGEPRGSTHIERFATLPDAPRPPLALRPAQAEAAPAPRNRL